MRLINADVCKQETEQFAKKYKDSEDTIGKTISLTLVDMILKIFDAMPTVEAEPIVCCKDCEYDEQCMLQSFVESESIKPFDKNTFYCSDGKRVKKELM